jgi:hypothetical protein
MAKQDPGPSPLPGTSDDLGRFVAAELPKWAEVLKESGAKVE